MQLLCVFCLLVCCEPSVVFTGIPNRTDINTDIDYFTSETRPVRTDSREQRATSDNSNDDQIQSTGLSETIKTMKSGFKVKKRNTRNEHVNRVNKSSSDELQALPKPAAQIQPTNFPDDPTTHSEWEISPAEDYEEPYTPLGPVNTRSRTPGVKNPFYPVTGDSYGAYAVMCISVVIFTVGIIGNIAIMCIVCHNYYMRSISNSLLANLALWDFVNLFFCLPLVIFHELTKDWLLGEFSCKIIPYIEVNPIGCVQVDE